MLKKLRMKFIFINMMMAVLVLGITFGVVCYLSYVNTYNLIFGQLNGVLSQVASSMIPQIEGIKVVSDAQISLGSENNPADGVDSEDSSEAANESLSENSVTYANSSTDSEAAQKNDTGTKASTSIGAIVYDETILEDSKNSQNENDSFIPAPNIGMQGDAQTSSGNAGSLFGSFSSTPVALVAVYRVDDQGFYTAIPEFSAASMTESVLLKSNDIVTERSENAGVIPEFALAYERMPVTDGFVVAYEDATSLNDWKDLALLLAGVGVAALAVFFLINLAFARWALKPIAISIRHQKESIKKQQQFTADASHELKTPLTVILANMSILRSSPESTIADEMQWIDSTQTEAERMQLLVNDMLDLARPKTKGSESVHSSDQSASNFEEIDFSDLVEGEVLQFESVAFENGIELISEIEKDLDVKGSADRLGRMVSTLIDNACKYTEESGKVEIRLSEYDYVEPPASEKNGSNPSGKARGKHQATKNSKGINGKNSKGNKAGMKCAMLTVHNSGVPIAEEDLPYLFDRFYRADKARTSGKGGYGLGLAIGREIARESGGDIGVISTEEDGTTFTVLLPLVTK